MFHPYQISTSFVCCAEPHSIKNNTVFLSFISYRKKCSKQLYLLERKRFEQTRAHSNCLYKNKCGRIVRPLLVSFALLSFTIHNVIQSAIGMFV